MDASMDFRPANTPTGQPVEIGLGTLPAGGGQADRQPCRGGPRTPAGKARSCRNAIKHGLTAEKLLPEVLGKALVAGHKERLRAEWQPTSPTQEFLADELARHAAALEKAEQAEAAVWRCGARGIAGAFPNREDSQEDRADTLLAGAVAMEAIDRITRYRRAHEKAFYAALAGMREAKAAEGPTARLPPPAPEAPFADEESCTAYLWRRAERGDRPCPHCGHRKGYWLAARRRWQCAGCQRQIGLRSGTVMAGSPLPIAAWFAAIRQVVENPTGAAADLAAVTRIRRPATIRRLSRKIRAAMRSAQATELLAGLDQVFGSPVARGCGNGRTAAAGICETNSAGPDLRENETRPRKRLREDNLHAPGRPGGGRREQRPQPAPSVPASGRAAQSHRHNAWEGIPGDLS